MSQFYFSYSTTSLDNSIDLMDISKFFVNAHSFKIARNPKETSLDLVLTVQGESTAELSDRIAQIQTAVDQSRFAGPPTSLGNPLLLWVKLGAESNFTIWTVLSGVCAPMDMAAADGLVYRLNLRLVIQPHSIGQQYSISALTLQSTQSLFIAEVKGVKPAPVRITLDGLPPTLAKLYLASKGHRSLVAGDFNPAYPVAGSVSISEDWQLLGRIQGHGGAFDNGLARLMLAVSDGAPYFSSITNLTGQIVGGALAGGAYEYLQTMSDMSGNEGPPSNSAYVTVPGASLIYSNPLVGGLSECYALGGICLAPFAYGIEWPSQAQPDSRGAHFRVASDGWVLSENRTEPLLVPGNRIYGRVGPTNKRPPKPNELGFAFSLLEVPLPASKTKRRSVTYTFTVTSISLGSLGSPIFFPIERNCGILFDAFGWGFYACHGDPIADYTRNQLRRVSFSGIVLGADVLVELSEDWSLGFSRFDLSINRLQVATIFDSKAEVDDRLRLGSYVSNAIPQTTNFRTPSLNEAEWSFSKVTSKAESDSLAVSLGLNKSLSNSKSKSTSSATNHNTSDSKSANAQLTATFSGSEGKSKGTSDSSSDGKSDSKNSGENSSQDVTRHTYKNIPITEQQGTNLQGVTAPLPFQGNQIPTWGTVTSLGPPLTFDPKPDQFLTYPLTEIINKHLNWFVLSTADTAYMGDLADLIFGDYFDFYTGYYWDKEVEVTTKRDFIAVTDAEGSHNNSVDDSRQDSTSKNTSNSFSLGSDKSGTNGTSHSHGTSTSSEQSDGASSSNSANTGQTTGQGTSDSLSTSHSVSLTAPLTYDIPLPSYTRLVFLAGSNIRKSISRSSSLSTSTNSSTSSSASSSTSTSDANSSSHSLSDEINDSFSSEDSSSVSKAADASANDSTSTSKAANESDHIDSGSTSSDEGLTGDASFGGHLAGQGTAESNENELNEKGQDTDDTAESNVDWYKVVNVPEDSSAREYTISVPLARGYHLIFDNQDITSRIAPEDFSVYHLVTLSKPRTIVGFPESIERATLGSSVGDTTGSSSSDSSGSGGGKTEASSSGHSFNTGYSHSGSDSTSRSHSTSRSTSNESSDNSSSSLTQSTDGSTSYTYEDIYKLVPLVETIVPSIPERARIASVEFFIRDLDVYDGGVPDRTSGVLLNWTAPSQDSSQRIYRRNASLETGAWEYSVLNAGASSFLDDGSVQWIAGSPPSSLSNLSPSLFKCQINGIIDTAVKRSRLGYGQPHYLSFGPLALSPVPSPEPETQASPWYVDIYVKAGGSVLGSTAKISGAWLLPLDQGTATAQGNPGAPVWVLGGNRRDQDSPDVSGQLELTPGGNQLIVLGEDASAAPLDLTGISISLDITPESEWSQPLE